MKSKNVDLFRNFLLRRSFLRIQYINQQHTFCKVWRKSERILKAETLCMLQLIWQTSWCFIYSRRAIKAICVILVPPL